MLLLPWLAVAGSGAEARAEPERGCVRAQGPCPNCGKETQQYFGDILTIKGSRDKNTVECGNCKAKIEFNAESRTVRAGSSMQTWCLLLIVPASLHARSGACARSWEAALTGRQAHA